MIVQYWYFSAFRTNILVLGIHHVCSGKSTFLKMLTGQQLPDEGTVKPGETVVFGVYDQMGMKLDDEQRVMDFVKQRVLARDGSTMAEAPGEVMKLLKEFQFPKERWNERILRLSGGERRRLQLLSVLTQRPNFLILDEPVSSTALLCVPVVRPPYSQIELSNHSLTFTSPTSSCYDYHSTPTFI